MSSTDVILSVAGSIDIAAMVDLSERSFPHPMASHHRDSANHFFVRRLVYEGSSPSYATTSLPHDQCPFLTIRLILLRSGTRGCWTVAMRLSGRRAAVSGTLTPPNKILLIRVYNLQDVVNPYTRNFAGLWMRQSTAEIGLLDTCMTSPTI
jgi:hypothetical protein